MLIDFDLVIPPRKISETLGIKADAKAWKILRVRHADHEPIAVQTAYLPESYFPGLTRLGIENGSLYQCLRKQYEIAEAEETYKVTVIRKQEDAERLNVPLESPALHGIRVSSLQDGRKFEYTESILRGDRYVLTVKMKI